MLVALLGLGFMYLLSLSVIASLSLRILYSVAEWEANYA